MKAKLINSYGDKTYALIFETGDALMAGLRSFSGEHGLAASHFTGIGALSEIQLAYFDWEKKQYVDIPKIAEQVEVLTLAGDVVLKDGKPFVHAHLVIGKADGSAYGGHLVEARVRPTLEVVLTESPEHLQREFDPESGLPLIRV
ncbi:MAG: DNA-binding protein [Chloroflexi bacterium]|nr:DNA-binding protein [Chloroflexota bacterium]